jgi:NTE family protein
MVLEMELHAFNLLLEQRLVTAVDTVHPPVELLVVPPLCPVTVSPADFSQSGALIDRASAATQLWLDNGHRPVPGMSRALGPDDRAAIRGAGIEPSAVNA